MSTEKPNQDQLITDIDDLEKNIASLKERLPAHSIPPALVIELDDLDEQLTDAKQRLAKNNSGESG